MSLAPLDVVVVGCGTAGTVAATLLARQGHRVTLLEQAAEPGDVGAGIMLQHLGLQVLDHLDVLEPLRSASRPVRRVDAVTVGGRRVMDFGYADVPGASPALGVHRGTLFGLLYDVVLAAPVRVETGARLLDVRPEGDRIAVILDGPHGPTRWGTADLVVGADGARSQVRRSIGVARRDHPYAYGALWAVVEDPEEIAADVLYQCLSGTRQYLGVLPTGRGQSSIFWSIRADQMASTLEGGVERWRQEALPFAGRYAPLVEGVEELMEARYRDVVVSRPFRMVAPAGAGVVLLGDAAHAMSPQLGTGASLALADAWTLASTLAQATDLGEALSSYAQARAAHLRWYSWCTRLMMPAFQSDLLPLGWARDLLAHPLAQLPGVAPLLVSTLMGHRTSPVSSWELPAPPLSSLGGS